MPRPDVEQQVRPILQRAENDGDVAAVLLFGSAARGEMRTDSDVDVCLVLGRRHSGRDVRLEYLRLANVDVQVFQELPIWVRARILKEHRILLANDEDALYAAAFATLREWDDFRPFYEEYLEGVGVA